MGQVWYLIVSIPDLCTLTYFVIRVFKTIIPRLASIAISIFWLVFVAEEAGLNLILSENQKTGFLAARPI